MTAPLRIGIDIGGTFTDFVIFDPASGKLETFKLPSTPHDPSEAVLHGLERIRAEWKQDSAAVIHGSTVATNALLERKGARTALVTTQGFRDVLQIGRQDRPALYDLFADPPPPLVPQELRFEVDERVDHTGSILRPLDPAEMELLVSQLAESQVESVAVCLLFSFLRPEHETAITSRLRAAGYLVSPSTEILPEFREYERASTTAVNAFVSPVLDRYLSHLESALDSTTSLSVMQSNGGVISPAEARRFSVRCILSGPAGGVVGCEFVSQSAFNHFHTGDETPRDQASSIRVITFDMGGTSTDVSLIAGAPEITTEAVVSGCPIRIPMLDIHTIGAGGGSIARVDSGGALRVGPESAGADPGPACYGKGDLPTVTDANLVLGRLAPEYFLGGQMPLDAGKAQSALASLGAELGLDPVRAALGVVQVANAHMERALRVISVERGHDPRHFTLLSFGGAGGLHAVDLARSLGIPRVLVPPLASTLSAFGMLAAEVIKDYTQTVMLSAETPHPDIAALFEPLVARGLEEVAAEGIPPEEIRIERSLDMRCLGQSYELMVPFSKKFISTFQEFHYNAYGYMQPNAPVEIVNLRVRAIGTVNPPPLPAHPLQDSDPTHALIETREVIFDRPRETPLYRAESLQPGNLLDGPAVIVRADTTVLLGPDDHARVDGYDNLVIQVAQQDQA